MAVGSPSGPGFVRGPAHVVVGGVGVDVGTDVVDSGVNNDELS